MECCDVKIKWGVWFIKHVHVETSRIMLLSATSMCHRKPEERAKTWCLHKGRVDQTPCFRPFIEFL